MPRRPRVFLEGGMYHVYNRLARGARFFEEEAEAQALVDLLREVKRRDGLLVYAWCVLPTHYHVLIRTTSRPLWRSLVTVQVRYSKSVNRRHRVRGPVWQSRYKAKLVEDQRYFDQLVVYVHLNPVAAGLVSDPGEWPWSGHREIVKRSKDPLVDIDEVLQGFGNERRAARRRYVSVLRAGGQQPWIGEGPGGLPWWRFGRPPEEEKLEPRRDVPYVEGGRSSAGERPEVDGAAAVDATCAVSGVSRQRLAGRLKDRQTVRARRALAVVACDAYGLSVKSLADELRRRPDGVSEWLRSGTLRRGEDADLDRLATALDARLWLDLPRETKET